MRISALSVLTLLIACNSGGDSGHDHSNHGSDVEYTTSAATDGGSFVVEYTADPDPIPSDDYFTVTATVYAADDTAAPLTGAVVVMDADMPGHGHGMNVTPEVTDNGDGTYSGTPFLFHMSGDWRLQFAVTHDGVTETAEMYFDCCE